MRVFKFSLLAILLIVVLTSFSSCIIIPVYKNYKINREDLSSVDIYDMRNCENNYNDFFVAETPVYTLTDDQLDDFLSDLADIRFSDHIIIVLAAVDPSFSYSNWVIRLNYTDGTYTLISSGGYGETYDAKGDLIKTNHFGCDDDEWRQFISRYLPSELYEEQTSTE
ncbi:hypothetical protein SDC9_137543 [bioreactor metagenome]|uniref:Lipoprotein n=1 Tax=bioreactor metagenome TaxID=1076179 RepID=A0A645DPM1_9ZZZZ